MNSHRTLGGSVDPQPGAEVLSGTTNHADQLSLVTDLAFSGSAVGEALPAALDLVRDPCGGRWEKDWTGGWVVRMRSRTGSY